MVPGERDKGLDGKENIMSEKEEKLEDSEKIPHHCGWVALMGPPNAGKSTLLNSFLGQKVAIVTPKPQTTRNQIVGIFTDKNMQIIFMDTPGLAEQRGKLSKTMIQAARQSLDRADAIMLVLDSDLYIRHPEYMDKDLAPLKEALVGEKRPMIIVPNKIDIFADKSRMLPMLTKLQEIWPGAEIFPVSAQTGDGLAELRALIASRLPVAPAYFPEDQISTASLRFMAAEIIREQLFLRLHQEVPYGTAVEIESWQEDQEKNLTVIHAVIYVSRPMHKAMVIGKGGAVIKAIGTDARKEIEELLGTRVHLELWVKVREDWTEDEVFLRELNNSASTE